MKRLPKLSALFILLITLSIPALATASNPCQVNAPGSTIPKHLALYYFKGKTLIKFNTRSHFTTEVMKLSKNYDFEQFASGPYGNFIYASKGLKIYQLDLKHKRIRLFRTLLSPQNVGCENLFMKGNTLKCYAIGSNGPLKYQHAKMLSVRLPRQSGTILFQERTNRQRLKTKNFHLKLIVGKKRAKLVLRCGKKTMPWGSIKLPGNYKKEEGKVAIALAPNGRVALLFFPVVSGDLGVYGDFYAVPKGKKAVLLAKGTLSWPNKWSPDGQWLLSNGKATNLAGVTYRVPNAAFWGKAPQRPTKSPVIRAESPKQFFGKYVVLFGSFRTLPQADKRKTALWKRVRIRTYILKSSQFSKMNPGWYVVASKPIRTRRSSRRLTRSYKRRLRRAKLRLGIYAKHVGQPRATRQHTSKGSSGGALAAKVAPQKLQQWLKKKAFPQCLGITPDGKTGIFLNYTSSSPGGVGVTVVNHEVSLIVIGKARSGLNNRVIWKKDEDGKKTRKTSAATLRKNLEKIAKHSARLRMRKCHLTRSPSNQNLSFALTIQKKQLKIVFDEGDKGIDPALVVKRKGQKDIRLPKTSNVQSMEGVEFHTIFYLPNAPYLYLMLSQNMGEHGGVVPQYKRVRIPGF